jgi:hypothetical protein
MIGLNTIDKVLKVEENITSNQFSLETLLNLNNNVHLQIPLYQRLYVWGVKEIKLFIEDISEAFEDEQQSYYIGNMMFANNTEAERIIIDLIDGQQRFTTLWLMSIILSKQNKDLKNFAFVNNEPRLSFTSRDNVNNFFKQLREHSIDVFKKENIHYGTHFGTNDNKNEIEPLIDGISNIYNSLIQVIIKHDWHEDSLTRFGDYILKNLVMVQTTVPSKNNLNQIFESLNSGGKQLENHQILKSRFLKVLRDSNLLEEVIDVLVYKWEASSKMNLYLERSVYSVTSETWGNIIDSQVYEKGFESNQSKDYFKLKNYITNTREPINLLSILKDEPESNIKESRKQSEDSRSIISFSQLLLHTLRVYNLVNKIDVSIPVDSKNLLKYFDTKKGEFASEENVIKFIDLLFELRFLFDKYVIRWTFEDDDSQESLLLKKVSYNYTEKDKSISVQRLFRQSERELSLAQSVLHIVQESKTQYWLTPFLYFLYDKYNRRNVIERYNASIDSATLFIENLDNFFYCQRNENSNLSQLSFEKDMSVFENETIGDINYISEKLERLSGTFFFRYWFYKTEYLIWKYRGDFKNLIPEHEFELWNKYKITFKTSIEHIYPQSKGGFENETERALYINEDNPILKDYFGNLVLLTVNENSEYGALEVNEKKIKFKLKLGKNSIDSLKSSLIFNIVDRENGESGWETGIWNFSKSKYHLEMQILPLFKKHLNF